MFDTQLWIEADVGEGEQVTVAFPSRGAPRYGRSKGVVYRLRGVINAEPKMPDLVR